MKFAIINTVFLLILTQFYGCNCDKKNVICPAVSPQMLAWLPLSSNNDSTTFINSSEQQFLFVHTSFDFTVPYKDDCYPTEGFPGCECGQHVARFTTKQQRSPEKRAADDGHDHRPVAVCSTDRLLESREPASGPDDGARTGVRGSVGARRIA